LIKTRESIAIIVYDDETTKFKLKFVGREDIINQTSSMVFKPLVQSGRFKEQESLTV
jgi:hypothetical protein